MRKIASVLFVVLMSVSFAAFAGDNGSLKIGVLDVSKVLQNSPQVKATVAKLKTKFKQRQDKIASAQKKLQADQAKLKRNKSVMKQSEVDDLQMAIMDEKRDLRTMQENYVQAARLAQNQVMGETLKQIDTIVKGIAAKEHYDLILQRSNVAYASDKVDITSEVMKQLNAQKK